MPRSNTRVTGTVAARAVAAVMLSGGLVAGCSGSEPSVATTPGGAVPVGQGFTSDQLRQALLTEIAGYRRTGEPDSGEYGSLKAIQNSARLQAQVKLDRPACADATRPTMSSPAVRQAPAALTVFARDDGHTVTETLLAVSGETAGRLVNLRVASGCRLFRATVGTESSVHQVVESTGGAQLADGSRTVGVVTKSGASQVKTWYVVLHSRGYVASITLHGFNATRAEAERLARQAHGQAEHILP